MSLEVVDRVTALRARAHPLRLRMLSLTTGAAMSAAELGRELGISQALASYHVRVLAEAGALELAEEVVNRGGRERRYRYRVGAAEPGGPLDVETHELLLTAAVAELERRHADREDGPGLTVDAELWVSEEDWLAARDAVREALVRLHEVAVRPHAAGSRRVNATVLMFPMRDEAAGR